MTAWIPTTTRMPADNELLLLRMVNGSKDVQYAIGWYDSQTNDWIFCVRPKADEQVIEYAAIPT